MYLAQQMISSNEYSTFEKNRRSVVAKYNALQVSVNEVKLVFSNLQTFYILPDFFYCFIFIFYCFINFWTNG